MWQFPRQRLRNAGKCSSERRAVSSNVRTAHVAAEASRESRSMWEWNTKVGPCCLVGSNPIQSLLMLLANTGEPKKSLGNRRLVLNCHSQFAGTAWKCCDGVNFSVQAWLWVDAATCQRVSGTETAEVRCAVVLVFLSRHVLRTQPLYMATI